MKFFLKKGFAFTLALLLGLSASGCGNQNAQNTNEGENKPSQALTNNGDYVFVTGGTSGTYYPLGGAIASIVNKKNSDAGFNISVNSSGASKENIVLISKGEADFAIVQNDVADYAQKGEVLFDASVSGLATVASIYPEVVQVVVAADSGINTIADLKGKNVSIGDAGSGVEANAIQVLDAYGLSVEDIKVNRLSFKESAGAFKDGAIDAFFVTAGVPNTAITELALTRSLKLLNIDGDEAKALIEQYPFYTNIIIPKDVYKTSEDVSTIGVRAIIICREDLKEEEVYLFTKALYESLDELGSAHAKGKEFKLEEAIDGVTVPLHPGAKKFFVESGLEVS
ncbi:MAG: TAXI family TRAP transporter solute-binding subunit [Peptostreptococcaceae bacterium]|nr:TAXI family TRAP transporter solute-binding subunit [Peptostreptococcaceae bacterium]